MKNLDFFVTECKAMLDYCSIPYNLDVSVKISRRLRRAYGNCHRKNDVYTIYINDLMLRDDVTDKALENTILHELIHTCPECMNHGRQWKHFWMRSANRQSRTGIKYFVPNVGLRGTTDGRHVA